MSDAADKKPAAQDPKPAATSGPVAKRRPLGEGVAVAHGQGGAGVPMPRDMAEMLDYAHFMAKAGPMVGKAFQDNPGACMGIVTQAMRWGLDPFACSQKAYQATKNDADAPIAYEAQLVHAVIIKNAGLAKRLRPTYSGEGDNRKCTITGYFVGDDEPAEYTSPTLKKCKKNSPLWSDDPDQQLFYYSVRAWARRWCPDVIMGVYTPDERRDMPEAREGGQTMTLTRQGAEAEARETAATDDGETRDAEYEEVDPDQDGDERIPEPAAAGGDDRPGMAGPADEVDREDQSEANPDRQDDGSGEADEWPSDQEIVDACRDAQGVKAKRVAVDANRGALKRIAEASEDPALKKQAQALLATFDERSAP